MDRVEQAGDDHAERAAALEEYLALARAHEDETWFDVAAWSEDLANSYLALGRVDDAVRTIRDATRLATQARRLLLVIPQVDLDPGVAEREVDGDLAGAVEHPGGDDPGGG